MSRKEKIAGWVLGVLLFAGAFFLLYNTFVADYGPGDELAEPLEDFPEEFEELAPLPETDEEETEPVEEEGTEEPEAEPEPEESETPPAR